MAFGTCVFPNCLGRHETFYAIGAYASPTWV